MRINQPVQAGYLHSIASDMAVAAGPGWLYKIRESRTAALRGVQAYNVTLKHWNQQRGRVVVTLVPRLILGGGL